MSRARDDLAMTAQRVAGPRDDLASIAQGRAQSVRALVAARWLFKAAVTAWAISLPAVVAHNGAVCHSGRPMSAAGGRRHGAVGWGAAFDPTATLGVHRGDGFNAGFSPYQSTRLSRYNAVSELGSGYAAT
jgi:hypothetical protein